MHNWTNNVMGSWSLKEKFFEDGTENGDYNENVTVMAPSHEDGMGLRSKWATEMLVGTKKYEVAMLGFKEIA